MNKKLYYGFRYFSGDNTTTGRPNPYTGRYSIAGQCAVFNSHDELDAWLAEEKLAYPTGLGGGRRRQVTKSELRELFRGLTDQQFEEMIEIEQL